jgi:hypothetical protein
MPLMRTLEALNKMASYLLASLLKRQPRLIFVIFVGNACRPFISAVLLILFRVAVGMITAQNRLTAVNLQS